MPTTAELGYASVNSDNWYGLVAPAATAPDILERLRAASVAALQSAELRKQFESQNAHIDYVRALIGLNAYRSIYFLRGRGHAEAFFECTPEAYRSIFERLTRRR